MPLHYDITVLCLRLCMYECHRHQGYIRSPHQEYWIQSLFVWYAKPVFCLEPKTSISLRGWQRKPWISRNEQGLLNYLHLTSTNKTGFSIPNCFTTTSHKTWKLRYSFLSLIREDKYSMKSHNHRIKN